MPQLDEIQKNSPPPLTRGETCCVRGPEAVRDASTCNLFYVTKMSVHTHTHTLPTPYKGRLVL